VSGLDPDAAAYIAAVEAADTQALETEVKNAYNNFIVGCKTDSIWDAIKASCILAGARTLAGALVPLKGAAPTENGFVAGDYDRETGLLGDGIGKYIETNRANNADPQNSSHHAIYQTSAPTIVSAKIYIGSDGAATNGANVLYASTGSAIIFCGNRISLTDQVSGGLSSNNGLLGHTRSSSTNVTLRVGDTDYTETTNTSTTPTSTGIRVFIRPSSSNYFDGRLSFYSIGENLNLSLLEARLDTLMTDLATAIP
jgi:hypothetical protein